jgi:hypothetical protein
VNLINNIRVVTVTRRNTGGETTKYKLATQFLTVAYDGACYPNVSELREFPLGPCLAGKSKVYNSSLLDVFEVVRVA